MLIEYKKDIIYRLIRLGMELDQAFLIAECTDQEMEDLTEDEHFQAKLKYNLLLEEKRLLKLHHRATKIAAEKGTATPIQWKLAKMNPVKWGDGKDKGEDGTESGSKVTIILPDNNR